MENEPFNIFFGDRLRDKNISLEKLSELSGISMRHLENMLKGDPEELPPVPYLRGYFVKLGGILDFDGEAVWREWARRSEVPSSGEADRLPENRFSKRPIARYIWMGVVGLLLLVYLVTQLPRIFGSPDLYVANPRTDLVNTFEDRIKVDGTIANGTEVFINGEQIPVDPTGSWEKDVPLQAGLNTIEITAKKFLGREKKITKQVFLEPPASPAGTATTTASSTPIKP